MNRAAPLLLLCLLALAGCISDKGGVVESAAPWTVGVTRPRDVVARWGNPDAVFGDLWVWRRRRVSGGKLKASFMMVGATVRNISKSVVEQRLTFGPDGRLAGMREVDYTPGRDDWSINPWK